MTANIRDPRFPADEDCILPYILRRNAFHRGDETCAIFESGERWTHSEVLKIARRVGAGLVRAKVGRGDHVLVWWPNAPETLSAWFGINAIGAVYVAINTAYKGRLLSHVLDNAGARVGICHPDLLERLLTTPERGQLSTVYTTANAAKKVAAAFSKIGLEVRSLDDLFGEPDPTLPIEGLKPWDLQSICYTSGTTGPSKGVLSSYLHLYTMGFESTYGTDSSDRWVISTPFFHVGGTLLTSGALSRGGSIAILGQFRTETYLDSCREMGGTACVLIGVMAGFLGRSAPSSRDRRHGLRRVMAIPLTEEAQDLQKRFGFTVYTVFNMSEISSPITSEDNPSVRGSCGRVRAGVEARIVDENDCEVSTGAVGELILRTDMPWAMSHGYNAMPEATARAWRNGWFHTGDAFRRDADGNYFFVDRVKDAIRRRGENISSFEVESEVMTHPAILEVAAIGVPNELSEEDVLIALALKPGATLEEAELLNFLFERMPHFMVPRYIRRVGALPKTPTAKVEKHLLRAEGITDDTWDREAAGIKVRRERLVS